MKVLNKIAIVAVSALFLAAILSPAQASCGAPSQIATITVDGTSFVWNAGVFTPNYYYGAPGYAPGMYAPGNPPVTAAFTGVFWSVGNGDPAIGSGDDNGLFTIDRYFSYYGNPGLDYYEAGSFATTWAADSIIDGCISNAGAPGTTCTCVLLTDQDGATGYYAMAANRTDILEDTLLNMPGTDGNGNPGAIMLQAIPRPAIVGSAYDPGTGNVTLQVNVTGNPGDYNKDPGFCACGPVGFKVVQQVLPTGSAPPADRDAGLWVDATLVGGGVQDVNPLGATIELQTDCAGDQDVYFATQFYYDSGFVTNVVSSNSTQVECGPNLADPQAVRPRAVPDGPRELRAPRRSR